MSPAGRRSRAALALRVLLPFALYSLARDVDAAVGVVLHTTLDLPDFVLRALGLLDAGAVARDAAGFVAFGAALWAGLAALRARADAVRWREALPGTGRAFAILYLRPALTLIALVSLAARPVYPYAFTLPVALGQDWSMATDAAILAVLVATFLPALRFPAPGAASFALAAFVAYGLLTPESARRWEGHPGNEPKTLRMAVAIGHGLSLDVEGVSAGMESLTPRPLASAFADAARGLGRESVRMAAALAHGPRAVGASAIRATRITRQTVRGKDGGVYHVLAPGPSVLLAPLLRLDRALNLSRGTPGRLAVTVLAWNGLAAALVAAVFLLARDAGAGKGVAAAVAGLTALLPPLVFYSYQFYPEMLGALALAVAFRAILLRPWNERRWPSLGLALLLAALPWLHQKFLPVWGVLVVMALVRAVDALVTLGAVARLLVPQAVSAYLFVLYNFAITGSVRPDAVYLAWGPGGVSSARWGQGLFGLGLDARYGLLPYVPLYLLAAGGLLLRGPVVRRLRWGALPAAVYYLTVAAADNWSGAVCNLGRYAMPAVPFAIALVSLVLLAATTRRGLLAVILLLAAVSAGLAVHLWQDPHAANDCALLLARGAFADGNVYVPNLFIRAWSDGAPGLWARIAAWLLALVLLARWIRRTATADAGARPAAAIVGLAAVVLGLGLVLERWGTARPVARFPDAIEVAPGLTAFVEDGRVENGGAWIAAGEHDVLLRAREMPEAVRVRVDGAGVLRAAGRPALPIPPAGLEVDLPPETVAVLQGRRGVPEALSRLRLAIEAEGPVVLRLSAVPPVAAVR